MHPRSLPKELDSMYPQYFLYLKMGVKKKFKKNLVPVQLLDNLEVSMQMSGFRPSSLIIEVTENAINLVKTLQHDLDIVTIAHLLASLVQEETFVKGKDNIGLGLEEVELLIERAMQNRGGGGGGRNRGGYRGNRSGGGRSRHGRNGRSSGSRSGGGRNSRNGGQGSRN